MKTSTLLILAVLVYFAWKAYGQSAAAQAEAARKKAAADKAHAQLTAAWDAGFGLLQSVW